MLLSQSTEGVIVASLSISAVVMECLSNGASYVLARLVSQDPSLLKCFSDTSVEKEDVEKLSQLQLFQVVLGILMCYDAVLFLVEM